MTSTFVRSVTRVPLEDLPKPPFLCVRSGHTWGSRIWPTECPVGLSAGLREALPRMGFGNGKDPNKIIRRYVPPSEYIIFNVAGPRSSRSTSTSKNNGKRALMRIKDEGYVVEWCENFNNCPGCKFFAVTIKQTFEVNIQFAKLNPKFCKHHLPECVRVALMKIEETFQQFMASLPGSSSVPYPDSALTIE
eukprot:776241_1